MLRTSFVLISYTVAACEVRSVSPCSSCARLSGLQLRITQWKPKEPVLGFMLGGFYPEWETENDQDTIV